MYTTPCISYQQRSMSVTMGLTSVNTSALIHQVHMFAPATLDITSLAMDSPALVRANGIQSCTPYTQKYYSDNDECAAGTDRCAQICSDTPGSYTCSCQPGYALSRDNLTCNGTCLIQSLL